MAFHRQAPIEVSEGSVVRYKGQMTRKTKQGYTKEIAEWAIFVDGHEHEFGLTKREALDCAKELENK